VCEAGAIVKSEAGVVTIDDERCNRLFRVYDACPFGAVIDRAIAKRLSAIYAMAQRSLSCVLACKCGALVYGQET